MDKVTAFTIEYPTIVSSIHTPAKIGPPFTPNRPIDPSHLIQFDAIWDTGAMGSMIARKVTDTCEFLKPIGIKEIVGVGGKSRCNEYLISLLLPNEVVFYNLPVTEAKGLIGADVLIGMDVIRLGDFAISSKGNTTMFSFRMPSIDRINLGEQRPIGHPAPMQMRKVGRNEPCPCGSGKKYKKCCGKTK